MRNVRGAITYLMEIAQNTETIQQVVEQLEDKSIALRITPSSERSAENEQMLLLIETILRLIQKPEQQREEREINFEQAAQEATYISPDNYL